MRRVQDMVREFHETFRLKARRRPTMPSDSGERMLRFDLQEEELDELYEGLRKRDLVEVADALADSVYVAYGTAVQFGIDLDAVLEEVHRSNMSKLEPCTRCRGRGHLEGYDFSERPCPECGGRGGKPIYREDGKVLKGPGFFEPDIKRVLDAQT